jgi:DNA-binding CsgD family transcriptional regulator
MNRPIEQGAWALTEKEKQTLRLIVRGHDAKSTARSLGLSVHTINERLRDARRKMAVSSSRQAARLLLEAEGGGADPLHPEFLVDTRIGEDAAGPRMDQGSAPVDGAGRRAHRPWIIIGVLLMTLALALLAFSALPQAASIPSPTPPVAARAAPNAEVVDSARRFLALLDQSNWDESYQATAASFRALNTLQVWASVSETARRPLGAMISRTFASEENLPAPPHGYEVVKFRTRYANRAAAVETVTLDREDGGWRVVGVMIE